MVNRHYTSRCVTSVTLCQCQTAEKYVFWWKCSKLAISMGLCRNSLGRCYFRLDLAFFRKKILNSPNGFLWSTHLVNKARHTKKNSNKGRQQNKIVTKGFKIFWLIWPICIVALKYLWIMKVRSLYPYYTDRIIVAIVL